MNPSLTELILIVDRSGSMQIVRMETIDTVNAVVRQQLEDAAEVVDLTLALFDTTVDILTDGMRVNDANAPVLTPATYEPDGCTALHDAVAMVIDRVGTRLASLSEEERPGAVVVAILTDGFENASVHHTLADVARLIDHQQRVYNWQFLFLGANQDAWATGQSMGLQQDDAKNWTSTKDGMASLHMEMSTEINLRKERARGTR